MQKEKIDDAIRNAGVTGDLDAMNQVAEYVTAMDNAPLLIADGLNQPYKIILEHNGHVLAGYEYEDTQCGYQFATWRYTSDKSGVEIGHYYPTWSPEFKTSAFDEAKHDFALRSGLMISERSFSKEQLIDIYEIMKFGQITGLLPTHEKSAKMIMEQIENSDVIKRPSERIESLIDACEREFRSAPQACPTPKYPWGIREVGNIDELIEAFEHGNSSICTGFIFDNLAFIEETPGGYDWFAFKYDDDTWKPINTIPMYQLLHQHGMDYCRSFIYALKETPLNELKYPSDLETLTMQL